MTENPDCVIFDVDGTLVDVRPIRHLVADDNPERNFHEFHVQSVGMQIIEQTRRLWEWAGEAGLFRVVVTARQACYVEYTWWHLALEGMFPDDMYMRRINDGRPDAIVKEEILRLIETRYNPILAVDDNPNVIEVWERNRIPTITIPGWGD